MRLLPFVALAGAFIVPSPAAFEDLAINDHRDPSSWLKKLPSKDSIASAFEDVVHTLSSGFEDGVHSVENWFHDEFEHATEELDELESDLEDWNWPHHGHGGHHPHVLNKTIYELISESEHTTKFAKLVDEYEDIVKLLNSTKANYTLFVPIDPAFEHIPEHKKPSKEFVEAVLKYHVGIGLYPAGRILATHTIPTALKEPLLGDEPQRLRTRVGLGGVRLNFYSKVVRANFAVKNGFVHAVDHILVPPPFIGRELTLFPQFFSTLLLAYEKTDFVKFIHNVQTNGSTVFAPTNRAFTFLGPRANAFLFNTETGHKYLRALLKYQIVANATLYSDAYYESKGEQVDTTAAHYHLDLPTLLGDKSVAVDVFRFGGLIRLRLNGYVPVTVQDGVAKNGVVQVTGRVLIPPHRHGKKDSYAGGEIEVEELKERLVDLVEKDDKQDQMGDL